MSDDKNAADSTKIFGFQIHHILPLELFERAGLQSILSILGINSEARGNKISLLTDAD